MANVMVKREAHLAVAQDGLGFPLHEIRFTFFLIFAARRRLLPYGLRLHFCPSHIPDPCFCLSCYCHCYCLSLTLSDPFLIVHDVELPPCFEQPLLIRHDPRKPGSESDFKTVVLTFLF